MANQSIRSQEGPQLIEQGKPILSLALHTIPYEGAPVANSCSVLQFLQTAAAWYNVSLAYSCVHDMCGRMKTQRGCGQVPGHCMHEH